MDLLLRRFPSGKDCTIGELFVHGDFECYTLEDVMREEPGVPVAEWKVSDQTAIPAGLYSILIDYSPHFQRFMPHVMNVPGFSGVRIHAGNTPLDTEGCILVGRHVVPPNPTTAIALAESRVAFNALYLKIVAARGGNEPVSLRIVNPDTPVADQAALTA